jgi:NADH-quinone oxidoreductase subunit M
MYQRTMTGPLREDNASITDLKPLEMASLAPAVVLMIGLGFFPQPLLNVINPAVDATLAHIGVGDPAPQAPPPLTKPPPREGLECTDDGAFCSDLKITYDGSHE